MLKCQKPNHELESVQFICANSNCQLSSICCPLCIQEDHVDHLEEQFINIDDISSNKTINMSEIFEQLDLIEIRVQGYFQGLKQKLEQMNLWRLFQTNPTYQILNQISHSLKHGVEFQKISDEIEEFHAYIARGFIGIYQEVQNFKSRKEINLSADELFKKAHELCWYENMFEESIKLNEQILEIDSQYTAAYAIKGDCLRSLSRISEASKCVAQGAALDQQNAYILRSQAFLLFHEQQYQQAVACANLALDIKKIQKGQLKLETKKLSNPMRQIELHEKEQKIYSIDLDIKELLKIKAQSLHRLKRYDEAFKSINQAVQMYPLDPNVRQFRDSIIQDINKGETKSECQLF